MTARQTRIIAALCAVLVFVATATVLNAWQEIADQPTVAQVKAEALREYRRRVVRFMPPGLVNRATVLADLDDYAERLAPTQPTPVFEAMGLPTPEVPNVGGEDRG